MSVVYQEQRGSGVTLSETQQMEEVRVVEWDNKMFDFVMGKHLFTLYYEQSLATEGYYL